MHEIKTNSSLNIRMVIASLAISLLLFSILIYETYRSNPASFEAGVNYNSKAPESILAYRGNIYDVNGIELTKNIPRLKLSIIPNIINNADDTASILRNIEEVTLLPYSILEAQLKNGIESNDPSRPITIIDELTTQDAIIYDVKFAKYSGVQITKDVMRQYEESPLFSRIIGSTGLIDANNAENYMNAGYSLNETVGKSGLEYTYEKQLRGINGKTIVTKLSNASSDSLQFIQDARNGSNLYLSIDYNLQKKAHEALKQYADQAIIDLEIEENKTAEGTVIVMDINTGDILSYISLPDYTGEIFSKLPSTDSIDALLRDPARPLIDRNIMENFPPGSIFKPIVGIASLEESIATKNTVIDTKGFITIQNQYNPEIEYVFNDWDNHGPLNFSEGLARSSDVYYYYLSGGYQDENEYFQGLGVDKIHEYAKKFGIGSPTGIDLPGEISGVLPNQKWKKTNLNEPWVVGDTYQLGIGQSYLKIPPIQMLVATAAIGNGGYIVKPKLVKQIGNDEQLIEIENPKNKIDISDNNLNIMMDAMKLAADPYGTAFTGEPENINIGGKTGTAEYGLPSYNEEGKAEYKTHGWFSGFAPYSNPEIAIIVFLKNGVGSTHAGPIAKEVLEHYFNSKSYAYKLR